LAGLGIVIVKALGGEEVALQPGMEIVLPATYEVWIKDQPDNPKTRIMELPAGCGVRYAPGQPVSGRPEGFPRRLPTIGPGRCVYRAGDKVILSQSRTYDQAVQVLGTNEPGTPVLTLPAGCTQVVPGSSWGTFTIACTIPIALLVGLWMYRIRPGRVVEASIIGGFLTPAAVGAGHWVLGSPLGGVFSLTRAPHMLPPVVYGL